MRRGGRSYRRRSRPVADDVDPFQRLEEWERRWVEGKGRLDLVVEILYAGIRVLPADLSARVLEHVTPAEVRDQVRWELARHIVEAVPEAELAEIEAELRRAGLAGVALESRVDDEVAERAYARLDFVRIVERATKALLERGGLVERPEVAEPDDE